MYTPRLDKRSSCAASLAEKSGAQSAGAIAAMNSPAAGESLPWSNGGQSNDQFAPVMPAARTSTIKAMLAPRLPPKASQAVQRRARIGGGLAGGIDGPTFGNGLAMLGGFTQVDIGGGAGRLVDH